MLLSFQKLGLLDYQEIDVKPVKPKVTQSQFSDILANPGVSRSPSKSNSVRFTKSDDELEFDWGIPPSTDEHRKKAKKRIR